MKKIKRVTMTTEQLMVTTFLMYASFFAGLVAGMAVLTLIGQ